MGKGEGGREEWGLLHHWVALLIIIEFKQDIHTYHTDTHIYMYMVDNLYLADIDPPTSDYWLLKADYWFSAPSVFPTLSSDFVVFFYFPPLSPYFFSGSSCVLSLSQFPYSLLYQYPYLFYLYLFLSFLSLSFCVFPATRPSPSPSFSNLPVSGGPLTWIDRRKILSFYSFPSQFYLFYRVWQFISIPTLAHIFISAYMCMCVSITNKYILQLLRH